MINIKIDGAKEFNLQTKIDHEKILIFNIF